MKLSFRISVLMMCLISLSQAAGSATGTLAYKGKAQAYTITLTSATLVSGPDLFDAKTIVRRLLLSSKDISATVQKCASLTCATDAIGEGIMFEFDSPVPRINYWLVLGDGSVQYSGSADRSALKATASDKTKLAGTLTVDATAGGGPKVSVSFDAPLVKTFTTFR